MIRDQLEYLVEFDDSAAVPMCANENATLGKARTRRQRAAVAGNAAGHFPPAPRLLHRRNVVGPLFKIPK